VYVVGLRRNSEAVLLEPVLQYHQLAALHQLSNGLKQLSLSTEVLGVTLARAEEQIVLYLIN
jgi:hypothetical protein